MNFKSYFSFQRPAGHIAALDGLRGLAVLMVVLHHGTVPIWSVRRALFPVNGVEFARPLLNGWLGVDLFFVLSGFLITHHICNRYLDGQEMQWWSYMRRRILRIVPAYYGVLLLAVFGFFPHYTLQGGDQDLVWRTVYHLLFLQDYFPADIQLSFWSLGVEEKFYILAPFLLLGLTAIKTPKLKYAFILILLAYTPLARYLTFLSYQAQGTLITADQLLFIFRMPFHLAWDGLLAGVLCALLARDEKFIRWAKTNALPDILFYFGTALIVLLLCTDTAFIVWQATLFATGFGAIVLGTVLDAKPARFLTGQVLYFFAMISYSLYLTHNILFDVIAITLNDFVNFSQFTAPVQWVIFMPVYVAVCSLVALGFYFVLEKPFLLLRRTKPHGKMAE